MRESGFSQTEIDSVALSENVITPLSRRSDRPYTLGAHLDYLEEEVNDGVPSEFVQYVSHPLFDDFSRGALSYRGRKNNRGCEADFEIILDLYEFVENKRNEIDSIVEIEPKIAFLQQNYLPGSRQVRAARFVFDICRRLEEDYDELEGAQITTPYEHQDILEVAGRERLVEEGDEGVIIEYGPDRLEFEKMSAAEETFRELRERFCERGEFSKSEGPKLRVGEL